MFIAHKKDIFPMPEVQGEHEKNHYLVIEKLFFDYWLMVHASMASEERYREFHIADASLALELLLDPDLSNHQIYLHSPSYANTDKRPAVHLLKEIYIAEENQCKEQKANLYVTECGRKYIQSDLESTEQEITILSRIYPHASKKN